MTATLKMTEDAIYAKRDPEEEFFTLSVLGQKMLHTEESEDCGYIFNVQADGWWKEVKTTGLAFHKWYKWIDSKIEALREKYVKDAEEALQQEKELQNYRKAL